MPDPVTAGISVGVPLLGGVIQSDSARKASNAQKDSALAGQAQVKEATAQAREDLMPYSEAGLGMMPEYAKYAQNGAQAFAAQRALAGLDGAEAQRAAIQQVAGGEYYNAVAKEGERAMLANASATGGLRGGDIQGALAQFRPQLLQGLIDAQYSKLGGITALGQQTAGNIVSLGQNSAAQIGNQGLQSAAQIAGLQQQYGAASAGNALAQGKIISGAINQGFGMFGQGGGFSGGGFSLEKLFGGK